MTAFVSAEEAVQHVRSGDRVFLHGAAATPAILLDALVARANARATSKSCTCTPTDRRRMSRSRWPGHLRHRALFIGANVREAVNQGRADFVPVFLSDIPALFSSGALPLDVAFIQVSPPDAHGYCSLGTSVDAAKAAAESARTVIAQVNAHMPRTLGDSFVHLDQIDWAVRADCPLLVHPNAPISPTEQRIGEYVADLVEDGATLQLGIGGDPECGAGGDGRPTRPRRAHRDVLRRAARPGRRGRHHVRAEDAAPGQDRHHFPDGQPAVVRLGRRQPDDRDAPGGLHQRHARSSAATPG